MADLRMPNPPVQIDDVQRLLSAVIDAANDLGNALTRATLQRDAAVNAAAEATTEAAWGSDSVPPWNPNPSIEGKVSLSEAVGQALGTASMAWTPRPVGVFDSREAIRVYEGIMAWLSDWAHEQIKEANASTVRKIAAVITEQRDRYQHAGRPTGSWYAVDEVLVELGMKEDR